MAIEVINFKKDGGRISAEVICGHAQTGSYRLRLWEPSGNIKIFEKEGTFINSDDDVYDLPLPNSKIDGRFVQCLASVVMISTGEYNVIVKFSQDGNLLGSVNVEDETNNPSVEVQMIAELKQED